MGREITNENEAEDGAGVVEEELLEGQGPPDSARVDFPCDRCSAPMSWDPDADALACEHCGNRRPVPRAEGTIVERALEDAGDAARGLGLELRVARCGTCGAQVAFEDADTSRACVYCGSANVLAQAANRNSLRPESLIPLDVGREEVARRFQRWLKGLWFRPNALRRTKRFAAIGVYVPFWTFDCSVHSDWSADAGYYYYVTQVVTVTHRGRPSLRRRRVRRIRWVPSWGDRDDVYDDHQVLASKGLSPEIFARLGSFDTTELVPYRPEYLAGWRAEEYQVDLEHGWERARQGIVESQERRCGGDVPGDTHRNLRVQNSISDVRWKHVLLPIWSLQYRFRGETYTVLVNGQNGRVAGRAPYSPVKIALAVAALAALGGLIYLAISL